MCGMSHCLALVWPAASRSCCDFRAVGRAETQLCWFSSASTIPVPSYLHSVAISESLVLNPRFQPLGSRIHGLVGAALGHHPNAFDGHFKLPDNIEEFLIVVRRVYNELDLVIG